MSYLYVFIGGGLGSICRYALAQWIPWRGDHVPWGTFWANLLSCIVIGVLLGLANKSLLSDEGKWLFTIGLLELGHVGIAALYILLSIVTCLAGIFLGLKCTSAII